MIETKICDSESPESAVGTYLCALDAGHAGLHTWHSPTGKGSPDRLWTDDGIDFLGGPYGPASDPATLTCSDFWTDEDGSHIYCVRPKNHSGQHGNYHDEDSPTYWGYEALPAELDRCQMGTIAAGQCLGVAGHGGPHQYPDTPILPGTYGTTHELSKTPEGAHIPARFEIVIAGGGPALAKKVRLNGLEIPNVRELSVEYSHDDARTVILEIIATDILEVPE